MTKPGKAPMHWYSQHWLDDELDDDAHLNFFLWHDDDDELELDEHEDDDDDDDDL